MIGLNWKNADNRMAGIHGISNWAKNAKAVLSRYILFSAYFTYDEGTK